MSAHHVADVLCAGKVGTGRFAVVGVSIAKAAAFDYKIIDGVMIRGEGRGTRMLGLAGARLNLQQTDSQVGDHELVLSSRAIGIHWVPGWQGSVDHLEDEGQHMWKPPKTSLTSIKKTILDALTDHDQT